ncbi:RICIN domain-containing protein [Streptomyces sp. NBC_00322]|uniref:RICIN domain-containing protein n=1 Tax=Streptomyces sp. NBC_00322 TaxID=2975712 RepID=UPI002E2E2B90|nr:RICIN domain-containing protein [Streptomyces sp. NBC_00322]
MSPISRPPRRAWRVLGTGLTLLAVLLAGSLMAGAQLIPPSASAAEGHDHNHYVYFDASPGGHGFTPAVENASTDDMARLISWNYIAPPAGVSANSAFWWGKRHPSDSAYKRLHAEHSGKCVGVHGASVIQYSCNSNADQAWAVAEEGNGKGKLKNLATGKCILLGWGVGDPVVLGSCTGDRSLVTISTSGTAFDPDKQGPAYQQGPLCNTTLRQSGTYLAETISPWIGSSPPPGGSRSIRFKDTGGNTYTAARSINGQCETFTRNDADADMYQEQLCFDNQLNCTISDWQRYPGRWPELPGEAPHASGQFYAWDPFWGKSAVFTFGCPPYENNDCDGPKMKTGNKYDTPSIDGTKLPADIASIFDPGGRP